MRSLLGILLLLFGSLSASAQGFWHTTRDFPGGPKTSLTGLEDSILLTGTDNGIWRSVNEGFSWTKQLKSSYIYSLHASSTGTILAGGKGKIFISRDKGMTWDSVAVATSYPIGRIVENKDHEYFFIASGFTIEEGFVGDGVFYNNGDLRNWEKRNTGLPPSLRAAEQLAVDKHGRIYVTLPDENTTGQGGLYYSSNDGLNWQQSPLLVNNLGVVKVLNSFAISITPQDSVIVSVSGTAVNISTQLNLIKHIDNVANNSAWRPLRIRKTGNWWEDIILNTIHFSKNGDWYSSASSSISTGGPFYSTDQGLNWAKRNQGLGISRTDRYEQNVHYESSTGKLFMVQLLDERVYHTNISLLDPITISGSIKDKFGNPLTGFTVLAKNNIAVSNAEGKFSLVVPSGWSGTITPTMGNYAFSPASISITNAQESNEGVNFVGNYTGTYFVSGYVKTVSGQPTEQVLITGFPQEVYTNNLGFYMAEVPAQWTGTITPLVHGHQSVPGSILVSELRTNLLDQNFTVRKTGVAYIVGKVLDENSHPFINATLTGFPETTRIDANGNFYGEIPAGWSGTIIPMADGYQFTPEKIQVTNLQSDLGQQTFIASLVPTVTKHLVSGTITDSHGTPLSGILIAGFPNEVYTAADGSYSAELPTGWGGVVTPISNTYTFSPSSIAITNLSAPLANQDFAGTIVTGIDDEKHPFNIYPNPTDDGFIYLDAKHEGRIQISNMAGQIIWQGSSGDLSLKGFQLPNSGIYVLSVSDKKQNLQTIKVVVR